MGNYWGYVLNSNTAQRTAAAVYYMHVLSWRIAHAHNSRVNFFTTLISILDVPFIQETTKSRANMAVIKF